MPEKKKDMSEIDKMLDKIAHDMHADIDSVRRKHAVILTFESPLIAPRSLRMAQQLESKGYRVTILSVAKSGEGKEIKIGNVKIILLPKIGLLLHEDYIKGRKFSASDLVLNVNKNINFFFEKISELNPDILISKDNIALRIASEVILRMNLKGKIIPWIHDSTIYVKRADNIDAAMKKKLLQNQKHYYLQADALIVANERLQSRHEKDYKLAAKPLVISGAANLKKSKKSTATDIKLRHRISADIKTGIIFFDSSQYTSGAYTKAFFEFVANLINASKDFHLVVVSRDTKVSEGVIAQFIKDEEEKARMHCCQISENIDFIDFASSADFAVITDHWHSDHSHSLPNVFAEYIAAGIPIIATNTYLTRKTIEEYGLGAVFNDSLLTLTPQNVRKRFFAKSEKAEAEERAGEIEFHSSVAAKNCVAEINKVLESLANYASSIASYNEKFSFSNEAEKLFALVDSKEKKSSNKKTPLENIDNLRVLHCLTGSAGQPWATSRAQRKIGMDADCMIVGPNYIGYKMDKHYPNMDDASLTRAVNEAANNYDVVHYYFRSFFFDKISLEWPTAMDILALRAAGKVVVMNYRGHEVRLQNDYARLSPYNYVEERPSGVTNFPDEQQRLMLDFARSVASVITVPDVELGSYVPDAVVIPRALELEEWPHIGLLDDDNPLIVHAPTKPEMKGTEFILHAVENLQKKGLKFRFELVKGLSNAESREKYEKADIIMDQLRMGYYGVLAVEGMAMGKAVVSYVREDLLPAFGKEGAPVEVATCENVEAVLEKLITDKIYRRKVAKRGHDYCLKYHDSNHVAQKYKELYQDCIRNPKPVDFAGAMKFMRYQYEYHRKNISASENRAQNALSNLQVLAEKLKA